MNATGSDNFGDVIIIGKHRPAIAIGTKWLCRKKAGAGDICKLANRLSLPLCAKALCRIIDQPQAVLCRKCADGVIIGGLSKQPHANDADDVNIGGLAGCQCRIKFIWVEIEAIGFDFGKNRNGAHHRHHFGTCGKCERRHNDPLTWLQLQPM